MTYSTEDGKATVTKDAASEVKITDKYTKQTKPGKKVSMIITRRDEVTGKPIVGCKIQVSNSEGEVVDEWVTDGKPHTVEGLTPGETYTIHEVSTPEGVKPAKDIKVTVDEDGNVTGEGVTIENGRIIIETGEIPEENEDDVTVSLKVNKVDEQGQTLSGAKFSLCEINGNTSTSICNWESGQTPKDLSSVLKPGRTYKLVETQAPAGYCITFECYTIKVANDGTITVNGTKITSGTLSVVNKKAVTQNVTNVTTNTYVSTTTVGGTTSAGGATAAGTVRTGDDTNVMSFVIAAIAGILVIIGIAVILFRRRKRTL